MSVVRGLVNQALTTSFGRQVKMIGDIYTKLGTSLGFEGLKLSSWGFPAVIAGGWCAYPALGLEFKRSVGLAPPEPAEKVTFEKEEIGEMPSLG